MLDLFPGANKGSATYNYLPVYFLPVYVTLHSAWACVDSNNHALWNAFVCLAPAKQHYYDVTCIALQLTTHKPYSRTYRSSGSASLYDIGWVGIWGSSFSASSLGKRYIPSTTGNESPFNRFLGSKNSPCPYSFDHDINNFDWDNF